MAPLLIPDTIKESVPFYLREVDLQVKQSSPEWNFGGYEYLPTEQNKVLFDVENVTEVIANNFMIDGIEGSLIQTSPILHTLFFLLFLFCLIAISIIYNREGSTIATNFRSIFSFRRLPVSNVKEQVTTSEVWSEFYLIFQTVLVFSIVVVTYLQDANLLIQSFRSYALTFAGVFLTIAVFIGLKYILYRVIASFFLSNDIKDWISRYFRLFEILGLIVFIPTILMVYLPEYRSFLFIAVAVVFVVSRIVVIIETFNIFVKNKVGTFYFFSYLCGTEIAPYFLYYKLVLSIIRIVGNNIL